MTSILAQRPLSIVHDSWTMTSTLAGDRSLLSMSQEMDFWIGSKSWFWWNWKHSNCCRWNQKRYFWANKCNLYRGMCSPLTFLKRADRTWSVGNKCRPRVTMGHFPWIIANIRVKLGLWLDAVELKWLIARYHSISHTLNMSPESRRYRYITESYTERNVQNPKHRGSL